MSDESTYSTIRVRAQHVSDVNRVYDAADHANAHNELIADDVAVTIASWHQSSGTVGRQLAALASGAPVNAGDLMDDVMATWDGIKGSAGLSDVAAIEALALWVSEHSDADYTAEG